MPTTAEATAALTLVQAAIASPFLVDSIMAAEAAADNAMNADATAVEAYVTRTAEARRGTHCTYTGTGSSSS